MGPSRYRKLGTYLSLSMREANKTQQEEKEWLIAPIIAVRPSRIDCDENCRQAGEKQGFGAHLVRLRVVRNSGNRAALREF